MLLSEIVLKKIPSNRTVRVYLDSELVYLGVSTDLYHLIKSIRIDEMVVASYKQRDEKNYDIIIQSKGEIKNGKMD